MQRRLGKSGRRRDDSNLRTRQRELVEYIVSLFPSEKSAFPVNFLCCLLKAAIFLGASSSCKNELEKRISAILEHVTVDDLLVLSFTYDGERLFDLESVRKIISGFVDKEKSVAVFNAGDFREVNSTAMLRVAKNVDVYLGEIASFPELGISKINGITVLVPKEARKIDDDLYRAVDIYLKGSWLEPISSYGMHALSKKLKSLKTFLRAWSKDTFGNVFDDNIRAKSQGHFHRGYGAGWQIGASLNPTSVEITDVTPMIICWEIWKACNCGMFQAAQISYIQILLQINWLLMDIFDIHPASTLSMDDSRLHLSSIQLKVVTLIPLWPMLLNWTAPARGTYKLNVDGSSLGIPGNAG
ncbi:hypothetical protein ACH5RR_032393 [Cinchona calisaya]|uniref:NPH3 domain-containing protein n=1 Tax=Cinchona calisaya TaxID=153742 RepID=A0ABD2YJX3_9GENT